MLVPRAKKDASSYIQQYLLTLTRRQHLYFHAVSISPARSIWTTVWTWLMAEQWIHRFTVAFAPRMRIRGRQYFFFGCEKWELGSFWYLIYTDRIFSHEFFQNSRFWVKNLKHQCELESTSEINLMWGGQKQFCKMDVFFFPGKFTFDVSSFQKTRCCVQTVSNGLQKCNK